MLQGRLCNNRALKTLHTQYRMDRHSQYSTTKTEAICACNTEKIMTKIFIYIYVLVSFINAQFVFAQSNSDNFSQIVHTPGELIVRLRLDASSKQLDALSRKLGAVSVAPVFSPTTPAGQHPRLHRNYLIRFPAEWPLEPLRQRYARHPAIEAVEMNRLNRPCAETVPNDPNYGEQWNLALMNMPQAWGIEQGQF